MITFGLYSKNFLKDKLVSGIHYNLNLCIWLYILKTSSERIPIQTSLRKRKKNIGNQSPKIDLGSTIAGSISSNNLSLSLFLSSPSFYSSFPPSISHLCFSLHRFHSQTRFPSTERKSLLHEILGSIFTLIVYKWQCEDSESSGWITWPLLKQSLLSV